jgi:membrane fusion protein, multidrug efflux system
MTKKILIPVVIVVVIGIIAFRIVSRKPGANIKRPSVTLIRGGLPQRQTINYTVDLTGDITPIYESNIYSRVTGNLDKVYVNIGDHVKQNQIMALIDTTELFQSFEQASATYDNARLTYERTKQLADSNFVAQSDLDSAEAAMKVAQSYFDIALTNLQYAHIIAPFDGYITRRYLDPGALVNANSASLFTLVDLDSIKIFGNILEKDIPLVSLTTRASIRVDAYPDTQFTGAVTRMSGALDTTTRTMPIEIDVPNPGRLLKPGMYGYLTLILQQHPNALIVPAYAVLNDTTGNFVFILKDGIAHRRRIQTGAQQDSVTEVVSGLSDTDSIVTAGQQLLRDGSHIQVQGTGQE